MEFLRGSHGTPSRSLLHESEMIVHPPAAAALRVTTGAAPRLLVVGGTGFIGSHIVRHALRLGWEVTDLSLSASPATLPPRVRHVEVDLANRDAVASALKPAAFEYVVNCGGYIDHRPFASGGEGVFRVHFEGVLNLASVLDRQTLLSFVNFGSSDEYGNMPAPQSESQREAPISPYALGKVAATYFLQTLHRTEGFPATTLRPFLVFGPGQGHRRFLPQVIRACLRNESFPVSKGDQLRDFTHVRDVVPAVFATLVTPAARGQVINVASGRAIAIRKMVEMVREIIGRGEPRFGEVPLRPGEGLAMYADPMKARVLLGWEPKIPLAEGLAVTIQWFERQA